MCCSTAPSTDQIQKERVRKKGERDGKGQGERRKVKRREKTKGEGEEEKERGEQKGRTVKKGGRERERKEKRKELWISTNPSSHSINKETA